jgi:hypothetical protein
MKQEQIFTTTQLEKLLDEQFNEFTNKWRRVMKGSEIQTLAKFIQETKEKINETVTNEC